MIKIINLTAFCLPMIIFSYFGLLGYASLSLLRSQRNTLQNLLLSPAVGVSLILISVFELNQLGLPVKDFAVPLTAFFFLISIALILFRKPLFPFKKYALFAGICFLALCITGGPLLHFGFNWISYANDDMAHYCLGALRFLNEGYFHVPNPKELIQGHDYSQYYWFAFIPGMIRSGSELLIAWLSGLMHLNPLSIFMPFILSFHLILISATGAMLLISKRWYRTALLACLLLAFSALTTLGTLYQLIAQVLGLSLLITVIILAFETLQIRKSFIFKQSILLTITASALLIAYPEVVPIMGAALIVYGILSMIKGWKPTIAFTITWFLCGVESLLLLNQYWINIISFLQLQASSGLTKQKGALFPYFLLPSGLADLWGFQTLALIPGEKWAAITIILGFCFCILGLFFVAKQIRKLYPTTIVAFVMLGLATFLIIRLGQQSGFSLFKLAMYIQPFLFGVLAIGITQFISQKKLKIGLVTLVILFGLKAHYNYVQDSYGDVGRSFSELSLASQTHLPSELATLSKQLSSHSHIISDTSGLVTAQLQTLYLTGNNILFYSNSFFSPLVFSGMKLFKHYFPDSYLIADNLKHTLNHADNKLSFPLQNKKLSSDFYQTKEMIHPDSIVLIDTSLRSIFNRRQFANVTTQNFVTLPLNKVSNHLIFVNSSLGQYYYLGESQHISLSNLEKDYFYPENTMVGIGRYLLFQALNPTKKIRLELNMTESLNSDHNNRLPHAQLIGDKRYDLPLVGRGSARVFSSAFNPMMLNHRPYFMLDMQNNGKSFPTHYKGLMKLYGNNVPLDTRLLVGFVRDVSIVSDEEYQHLKAPSYLNQFPKDLSLANLEYSGIYEDGWFSEDAYLKLSQPAHHTTLAIHGLLPLFEKQISSNKVTVYIDNKKVTEKQFTQGYFDLAVKIPYHPGNRHIRLHFDSSFSLPKGDDRPVAAKIESIGFQSV